MHEITEIIRKRRSIYHGSYSGETVDDSIIKEMLENDTQVEAWKTHTQKAAKALTWENEAQQLKEVYAQFA